MPALASHPRARENTPRTFASRVCARVASIARCVRVGKCRNSRRGDIESSLIASTIMRAIACQPSPIALARALPRRARAVHAAASAGTLYDVPVSNNGARVRLISRWKGIDVDIINPNEAFDGGIKGAEYAALNPQVRCECIDVIFMRVD